MAREVRAILDCLDGQLLRKLCELRDLPVSGTVDEKRNRLSRSFRGHVEELLPHLHRDDMIAALEQYSFTTDAGRSEGEWVGLRNASWDELHRAMKKIFIDDWDPERGPIQPLGSNATIRIAWMNSEDADETDSDEVEEEDEDASDGASRSSLPAVAGDDVGEFYEWLFDYLSNRGASTLMIKTLVNRLGHYRADERLRTRAVQDLGKVLAEGRFVTDPDLTKLEASPGIDARVRLSRRGDATPRARVDWQPVPTLSQPAGGVPVAQAPPAQTSTPSIASDFERAAAKLKFLTTVAASIERPDEDTRRRAVDLAGEGLSLSAADRLRLRALAHQYAAGHEDLRVTIRQLRVALSETERRSLLLHLRSLAPATTELEELIQTYATDLSVIAGVLLPAEPAASSPAAKAEVATQRTEAVAGRDNAALDQVFEPRAEPPKAGGSRDNAALDDIFSRGGDS
jgi:hypothetical protein